MSSVTPAFCPGDIVSLHGLTSAEGAKLNGLEGCVLSASSSADAATAIQRGRVPVLVEDGGSSSLRSVRPENLQLVHRPRIAALEHLPFDVLEEVLQLLGPAGASPLRAASRKLQSAVDRVEVWRSLRLVGKSAGQIERAAAFIAQPGRRPFRLGKGASLELQLGRLPDQPVFDSLQASEGVRRFKAVGSLVAACSKRSGGLGGLSIRVAAPGELYALLDAALTALRDDSDSAETLKRLDALFRPGFPIRSGGLLNLAKLLSRFPLLEHLRLPYVLDNASVTFIARNLPKLYSVDVALENGGDLKLFAEHPALEELCICPYEFRSRRGFQGFAAGPAARRLRRLGAQFGWPGLELRDLGSLGNLSSLERLELLVRFDDRRARVDAGVLAGLARLRELVFVAGFAERPLAAADLRSLAAAVAALRASSLTTLRLWIVRRGRGPPARPRQRCLADLLRAAGPASSTSASLRRSCGGRRGALAACPRLRRLDLSDPSTDRLRFLQRRDGPPPPVAEAAEALAACRRLAVVTGLPIRFADAGDAAAGLERLRRLQLRLGDGAGSRFLLEPSALPYRDHVRAVFPKAVLDAYGPLHPAPVDVSSLLAAPLAFLFRPSASTSHNET
eukprot:tig00021234_g19416.t1